MFRLGLVLSRGSCRSFLRELQSASVLRARGNQGAETGEAAEGSLVGSKSCWWALSHREWELCGLRNVPLAVVPVALGSWRCVGNCQVEPRSCAQLGGLGESKEPESREFSEPVPVCTSWKPGWEMGLQAAPWRGALPGAAALMADPLLTVTPQTATGAERREEPLRGKGQKDGASLEPQQSLLEALSLLSSDDW